MRRNRSGPYIRVRPKAKKKAKEKLKRLTYRSQYRSLDTLFQNLKVFMRGWLGYYGIAEMKNDIKSGMNVYAGGIQVSVLFMIEPPCTERYARWCERTANQ